MGNATDNPRDRSVRVRGALASQRGTLVITNHTSHAITKEDPDLIVWAVKRVLSGRTASAVAADDGAVKLSIAPRVFVVMPRPRDAVSQLSIA